MVESLSWLILVLCSMIAELIEERLQTSRRGTMRVVIGTAQFLFAVYAMCTSENRWRRYQGLADEVPVNTA